MTESGEPPRCGLESARRARPVEESHQLSTGDCCTGSICVDAINPTGKACCCSGCKKSERSRSRDLGTAQRKAVSA